MNRYNVFAAMLLSYSAVAQNASAPESFIQARQPEVEKLAESLYSTHLDSRRWPRHVVEQCSSFTHHGFASFDAASPQGVRFVAIYDLDHAAARSEEKPWEGGVKLLRLKSAAATETESELAPALIAAFNRALVEEKAARGKEMSPADEAICLIRLAGDKPDVSSSTTDAAGTGSTEPVKVTSLLLPLQGSAGTLRTAAVGFASDETISTASLMVRQNPAGASGHR